MTGFDMPRRLAAEAIGTALLVATIVGSGIMADGLTDDRAIILLGNAIPTGLILVVLIAVLGPVSGAHFNPVVSLVFTLRGDLSPLGALGYVSSQIIGGLAGVVAAHVMFGMPLLDPSATARTGGGQWFSEIVATFGLLAVILGGTKFQPNWVPWLVGLFITAAYWFTSSTSFANPAIALARGFTDSFSGIRLVDIPAFLVAELAGALIAYLFMSWLLTARQAGEAQPDR